MGAELRGALDGDLTGKTKSWEERMDSGREPATGLGWAGLSRSPSDAGALGDGEIRVARWQEWIFGASQFPSPHHNPHIENLEYAARRGGDLPLSQQAR